MSTIMPRSALRHRPIAPAVRQPKHLMQGTRQQESQLPSVGLSMFATLLLLWSVQYLWIWGSHQVETLHYGYPRTTQADYVVGSGQRQHFLATNLRGQITVVVLLESSPQHAHILVGPRLIGPDADLAPIHLRFVGDSRHPNLLVEVAGVQTRFRPTGNNYIPVS